MSSFRNVFLKGLALSLLFFPVKSYGDSENSIRTPKASFVKRRGAAAVAGSHDTIAVSMMLWGTSMAVAIAVISALIETSDGSSSSSSGGGSSSHGHS